MSDSWFPLLITATVGTYLGYSMGKKEAMCDLKISAKEEEIRILKERLAKLEEKKG